MRILVTGADGYIGSVLAPMLVRQGHTVVGLDTGFYRAGWLFEPGDDRPAVVSRDTRRISSADLEGFDAIVHLAELSNDPLGEFDPRTTFALNHSGSVRLAEMAREAGVPRFVYASSCSIYGASGDALRTETSAADPQTAYAQCKVLVERDVTALADERFCPTFLRNATAFGASPRMRFDIVLNNLAGLAWTTGTIALTSDGSPWRPLVHIRDIAAAVGAVLEAPREAVHAEAFNVGDDSQNYTVREIAETVGRAFPDCATTFGPPGADNRSYRVSFAKIHDHLPGFRCRWNAERGAQELRDVFARIGLTAEQFKAPPFTRLRELQRLIETGQLDRDLYWRA